MRRLYILFFFVLVSFSMVSQVLIREASLSAGLVGSRITKVICKFKNGTENLTSTMLFIGRDAEQSREYVRNLSKTDRNALIKFLEPL